MKIKLIASDMDDTLLNKNHQISPRNEAAIKKAIEAGVVFTLASGRMYCSMQPLSLIHICFGKCRAEAFFAF